MTNEKNGLLMRNDLAAALEPEKYDVKLAGKFNFNLFMFLYNLTFPVGMQWFWLMNNLNTRLVSSLAQVILGPIDLKETLPDMEVKRSENIK